jgi:hypothetical protein
MDVPFLNPQHTHKNPCVSMHLAKKSISKNNKSPARKDVPNYAWFHARSHWKKNGFPVLAKKKKKKKKNGPEIQIATMAYP